MPLSTGTPGPSYLCSHLAAVQFNTSFWRSIAIGRACSTWKVDSIATRYHQQRLEDDSIGRWGGSRAIWDSDCSLRQRDRAKHVEAQRCNFAMRRQRVVAVEIRSSDGWSAQVSQTARLRLGLLGDKSAEPLRARDASRSRSVESHREPRSRPRILSPVVDEQPDYDDCASSGF